MNIDKNTKSEPKYAIITSFNKKDSPSLIKTCKYIVYYSIKYIFYLLTFNKRRKKYKEYIFSLFRYHGFKIIGHRALLESLIRGFDEINVPYTYNKLTDSTKNIIICWCDKNDIKFIEEQKKRGKIEKVITTPCACKYDYDWQYVLPEYGCIDRVLVPSKECINQYYEQKVKKEYIQKVLPWASGVKLPEEKPLIIKNSCICYYKGLIPIKDLTTRIEAIIGGGKCYNIVYGKYFFEDWIKLLDNVDLVIFYQDIIETQGLAMAEVWAHNKPTIIKTKDKIGNNRTSPYLNKSCGLFFKTTEELEEILKHYSKNPELFLKQFKPREWVRNNMTDEKSVKNLIKIFNDI
ncbi:MAG: hypothetical protein ACI37R_06220 [Candidatus Avigastranaerophilus sp.]